METSDYDMKAILRLLFWTSLQRLLVPNGPATGVVEITTMRIAALNRRNAISVANTATLLQYAGLGLEQRRPIHSLVKITDVPKWVAEEETPADSNDEMALFTFGSASSSPIRAEVEIDNKPVSMEVDTGAAVSIMSGATFAIHFLQKQSRS